MDQQTTIVHEIPGSNNVDTSKSWRMARRITVLGSSLIAAIIGFFATYSDSARGDSEGKIMEFEASLKDYIRAATYTRCKRIVGVDFQKSYVAFPVMADTGEESIGLARIANALSYANAECARARINQAVAEFNYQQSGNGADLLVHSDASLHALKRDWVTKNIPVSCAKALGVAVIAGTGGWLFASCVILGLAFVWWFMMDRVRDVSRAIRGK